MPAWQGIHVRDHPTDSNNRCESRYPGNSTTPPVSFFQCALLGAVEAGPSPRLRGKPFLSSSGSVARRSIPAPAGEPKSAVLDAHHNRVYPRACGGTLRSSRPCRFLTGLSPRVRGNQMAGIKNLTHRRGLSPRVRGNQMAGINGNVTHPGVYPRACGGTTIASPPNSV